jgi:hypothetical protein
MLLITVLMAKMVEQVDLLDSFVPTFNRHFAEYFQYQSIMVTQVKHLLVFQQLLLP